MSDAYSRLYHRFKAEFPHIYDDDRAFAAWCRLLMLADAAWPMRPDLPRSLRPKVLALLQGAGLVSCEGEAFTIRGLDAERTRRSDAGRTGAAKRWHSDGTADAMPRRDEKETRRDEKEIPPPPAERGRRKDGTNPRSVGAAPRDLGADLRSNGHSPRQVRDREKRAGFTESTASILAKAAAAGRGEDDDDDA